MNNSASAPARIPKHEREKRQFVLCTLLLLHIMTIADTTCLQENSTLEKCVTVMGLG